MFWLQVGFGDRFLNPSVTLQESTYESCSYSGTNDLVPCVLDVQVGTRIQGGAASPPQAPVFKKAPPPHRPGRLLQSAWEVPQQSNWSSWRLHLSDLRVSVFQSEKPVCNVAVRLDLGLGSWRLDHFTSAGRDGHRAGFLFVFPICRLLLESNELLLTFLLLSWFP